MTGREYLDLAIAHHAAATETLDAAREKSTSLPHVIAARLGQPGGEASLDATVAAAEAAPATASAHIAGILLAEEGKPKSHPPKPPADTSWLQTPEVREGDKRRDKR